MIKIAIIGTRGIPNNYGGFEQFAQYLSKGLAEKSCDVYVYNSHNHPFKEKKWQNVNIIHKFDPEYRIGLAGQFIYDFNCILDSRKRNFDIILQLGYTTNSIWCFLLPKKSRKVCNPDGMEWKRAKYPNFIKRFLKFAEKLAVKSNDILIADSEVIKKYYIDKYNKKTFFIAYPAEIIKNFDIDIIKKYNLKPKKYFLLIARLQEDNNIETIIKGVIDSKIKYPLVIVGNYETKYGNYLKNKYIDEYIVFVNAIYNAEILNNLRYFSAMYFHGHSAGGTNPSLLEAMATSCLICANDNPYNRSVLNENALYFKKSSDIKKILDEEIFKVDFSNLKHENLLSIEQNYNFQKIIDEYYNVFFDLLNKKKSR